MPDHEVRQSSTTQGLPVAPSMGPTLEATHAPRQPASVDRRVVFVCALATGLAFLVGWVAKGLTLLIGLITNLAFHHRLAFDFASPAGNQLGGWVVLVPVAGALVVGLM